MSNKNSARGKSEQTIKFKAKNYSIGDNNKILQKNSPLKELSEMPKVQIIPSSKTLKSKRDSMPK